MQMVLDTASFDADIKEVHVDVTLAEPSADSAETNQDGGSGTDDKSPDRDLRDLQPGTNIYLGYYSVVQISTERSEMVTVNEVAKDDRVPLSTNQVQSSVATLYHRYGAFDRTEVGEAGAPGPQYAYEPTAVDGAVVGEKGEPPEWEG